MKHQIQTLLFLLAAGVPLVAAQQAPPPPPPQTAAAPAQPVPYSARGTIEQLNYDRAGSINGFLMTNGVLVFTPPIDGTVAAPELRKGSSVNVQGVSRQTPNGRTVVDAQSMRVGSQTIVFTPAGPAGPRPPRRGPRALAAAPPPPPPPPAGAEPPPPPPAPPQ